MRIHKDATLSAQAGMLRPSALTVVRPQTWHVRVEAVVMVVGDQVLVPVRQLALVQHPEHRRQNPDGVIVAQLHGQK